MEGVPHGGMSAACMSMLRGRCSLGHSKVDFNSRGRPSGNIVSPYTRIFTIVHYGDPILRAVLRDDYLTKDIFFDNLG
jgi:hypothetical protein